MKKKYIAVCISMILIISIIAIIINKNNKEYIMQDGILLALTLDGEKINEYPEGKNYEIEINCENGKGKWLVDEWKLAIEEITGNVVCNIDFKSNPKSLKTKVEEVNVNNNYNSHGYRYSGKTPDNYIWFNNEMWRIIGSIPTCLEASCGTNTTNLVKIIRDESLGGLSFGTPNWGSNKLYTLLNSYYYGAENGTGTNYCYSYSSTGVAECNYTEIGIDESSYYGRMVKQVYWNTGISYYANAVSAVYTTEIETRTVSGYIGLMAPSDYGYAASSDYHTTKLSGYNTSDITGSNWLYGTGNEWTSVARSSNYLNFIEHTGSVIATASQDPTSYYGYGVRPVVYLDPSAYIISGDGTEGNPYQIGM